MSQQKTPAPRHFLCSCGNSMDLDSAAISTALGYDTPLQVHHSLCTEQQDVLSQHFAENKQQVVIACTQYQALFSALAEEQGSTEPVTVNIREQAGWTQDKSSASAKMAALIALAQAEPPEVKLLSLTSHGRCLIYRGGEAGLELAKRLSGTLGVTLMLDPDDDLIPDAFDFSVTKGKIAKASGSFTTFKLSINQFAEMLPHSRDEALFSASADNVDTECDLMIDLSGETPLFTGWQKRDGYFRADSNDGLKIKQIEAQAAEMIGGFEKPLYVKFDEALCAHTRNGLTGCTRCIDVCPAVAITTTGDSVSIDSGICGGCGMCGAVCPSGAAQTDFLPLSDQLTQIDLLSRTYQAAGGKSPHLLLHDAAYGDELISLISRFGDGLPAHLIPYKMHSVGRVGHDMLVSSIASGFERVMVMINPNKADELGSITDQFALASALLEGAGISSQNRFELLDETDPQIISDQINRKAKLAKFTPARIVPLGAPRAITRLAMRALATANKVKNEVISLPSGAPYGRVEINTDKCTICLSCVGACPAGALQDNPDAPQLLFREDACLQCGICKVTCPEKVIELVPQFNLADSAMATELIIEDQPYHCKECGKAFGTTKSIEAIIERLSGHSMFQQSGKLDMLKLCEDCRVDAIFSHDDKLADVGERKKPRTTDDYLN